MDLALAWARCKAGDAGARGALIEHYSGMPARIARRLHPAGVTAVGADDLASAGMVGLIDAVDRYEPDRGVPFEAYAILRIRGAILDELRSATGGRRAETTTQLSLDELLEAGDHTLPVYDGRAADGAEQDVAQRVESALRYLPDRQREVIARYYGDALTLREAGLRMGISEARACQLHGRAIETLRRALLPATAPAAVAGAAA